MWVTYFQNGVNDKIIHPKWEMSHNSRQTLYRQSKMPSLILQPVISKFKDKQKCNEGEGAEPGIANLYKENPKAPQEVKSNFFLTWTIPRNITEQSKALQEREQHGAEQPKALQEREQHGARVESRKRNIRSLEKKTRTLQQSEKQNHDAAEKLFQAYKRMRR